MIQADTLSGIARELESLPPEAFPDTTERFEIRETHISRVYLTDHYAFKQKKPVELPFLHARHRETRRRLCLRELELNRRWAPAVYLNVLPVVRAARGAMQVGGEGEALDWVVQMRRLPDSRSLESLLRLGPLPAEEQRRLVVWLAERITELPPLQLNCAGYRRDYFERVLENGRELREVSELPADLVQRVQEAQQRWISLRPELLERRCCDGRVVDGHGDLRPEHVYLLQEPAVIDCLEFSAEFRRIDTADEISFLEMECRRLGRPEFGEALRAEYELRSGDHPRPEVWAFFRSYRATVRAKVLAIRARQVEQPAERARLLAEAEDYLLAAARDAERLTPPLLLVTHGLSGSGKSTLASQLAARLDADHLQTDRLRREEEVPACGRADSRNEGRYSAARRLAVYRRMFNRAKEQLHLGRSVVLDGVFTSSELRSEVLHLAAEFGAIPLLLHCQCPAELAVERITERARGESLSEATPEVYFRQVREEQPNRPEWPSMQLDTSRPVEELADAVLARVGAVLTAREEAAGGEAEFLPF